MATANQTISTPFGQVSQVTTGQTVMHTVANWMWLPMILMGVMAVATAVGLGIAQAQVASDLGEDDDDMSEVKEHIDDGVEDKN